VSHAADAVAPLATILEEHGAVEWTQRLCTRYADRALRALKDIGVEPARTELAAIATTIGRWRVSRPQRSQGARHEARHAVVH
jgi:geranylgeranyl pyrophosphate synthase